MLLSQLDEGAWESALLDWVEVRERTQASVEVVATAPSGRRLAVEHTLVQPYAGEKFDTEKFMKAFGAIEGHRGLALPGRVLNVAVGVGAVPNGYRWGLVGTALLEWLLANHLGAPARGERRFLVNVGCCGGREPLELEIWLSATPLPGEPGRCLLSRFGMPGDLREVVRKALKAKVPKLVRTPADKRILLFERDQWCFSELEIYKHLAALGPGFQELAGVDDIWFANTADLGPEGWVYFYLVDGRGLVESLRFRHGALRERRDDRPRLGPAHRGF